jgi:hypothetical protein
MASGLNMIKKYEERIRGEGDSLEVRCNSCITWKPCNEFHRAKGKYKSTCKECHKSKYGSGTGYKPPSQIQRSEESRLRKEKWLAELQTCTSCESVKPRREFYNDRQKAYLPYCCSTRRTSDQIESDISEQKKTCFICGLRLDFDEFGFSSKSRDERRPYCKCCEAARAKVYSDRPERVRAIQQTDDGSIDVKSLSEMIRKASNCQHCGIELVQDYPVGHRNKTIDHDVPLSRGGLHTLSNITIMCLGCNSSKGQRTLSEFSKVKKKRAAT